MESPENGTRLESAAPGGPSKALSVAAFALMGAGLVLQMEIGALFLPVAWVIAAQVLAVLLMLWARVTFRSRSFHFAANPTAGGLVTTGPYRYIRHPIYTAACLLSWPGALRVHSGVVLAAALLVTAGAVIRMLCEERLLVARYPEYRDYARHTRRVIPGIW